MLTPATAANPESNPLDAELYQPKGAPFPVRRPKLNLARSPRYWADNNALLTWHMIVLSSAFPDGEQFFVDSVRHFRDQLVNPRLRAEVAAFIGQEARHAEQHRALNELAGPAARRLQSRTGGLTRRLKKMLSPRLQLCVTACAEHFTATWGANLLRRVELLDNFQDEQMRKLWAWHAIEETEHKATAFDVYREAGGSEVQRMAVMLPVTLGLMIYVIALPVVVEMIRDGQLTNFKDWRHGLAVLLGKDGFYPATLREYLDWYRPGFHPTDHDTHALLEEWRSRLGLPEPGDEAMQH